MDSLYRIISLWLLHIRGIVCLFAVVFLNNQASALVQDDGGPVEIKSISSWEEFLEVSKRIRSIPDNVDRNDWTEVRNLKVDLSINLIQKGLELIGSEFDPDQMPGKGILLEGHPELNLVNSVDEIQDRELRNRFLAAIVERNEAKKEYSRKIKILDYTRMHISYLNRFIRRFYTVGEVRNSVLSRVSKIQRYSKYLSKDPIIP